MPITHINVEPEINAALQQLITKSKQSETNIINQAIKDYIEKAKLEEKRQQQTLDALDCVAKGDVVPADKVFAWMESWDTEKELPKPQK